jgi:hypothetical protein
VRRRPRRRRQRRRNRRWSTKIGCPIRTGGRSRSRWPRWATIPAA